MLAMVHISLVALKFIIEISLVILIHLFSLDPFIAACDWWAEVYLENEEKWICKQCCLFV